MTESELRFILSAQDEGLQKAIVAAEQSVLGLDKATTQLAGTTLRYNAAAQQFVSQSGRFVGQQKALAQAGLVTTRQLTEQIQTYDQLIVRYKDDLVLTQQLVARKQQLLNSFGTQGRALRTNTQLYFQAGQAISDFAVAGVRGAANNIEFLAAQLGASGPLIIGISLASAAFFAFGDDILRALDPVGQKVKELSEGFSDVLRIIDGQRPDLFLFEDQIPAAMAEAQDAVRSLREELQGLIGANQGSPELSFLNREQIREVQVELARAETLIGQIEERQEDLARLNEQAFTSRTLSAVRQNELLASTLRADLERIGLAEELNDVSNEQLVTLTRQGQLREFVLKLQEDSAKAGARESTELERAREKLEEIRAELDRRRGGELSVLDRVRDQTVQLREQLVLVKRLNEDRALQARIAPQIQQARDVLGGKTFELAGPQALPAAGEDAQALFDRLLGKKVLRRGDDGRFYVEIVPRIGALRESGEIPGDIISETAQARTDALNDIIEGTDRSADAFDRARISAAAFYTETRAGQVALADAIVSSVGSITGTLAELYEDMYRQSGDSSKKYFRIFKAFATAQAIINTYQAATKALAEGGPIIGPILMAATIVTGLAQVAKIQRTEPGSSAGGGGATSGGRGGFTGLSVTTIATGADRPNTQFQGVGVRQAESSRRGPTIDRRNAAEQVLLPGRADRLPIPRQAAPALSPALSLAREITRVRSDVPAGAPAATASAPSPVPVRSLAGPAEQNVYIHITATESFTSAGDRIRSLRAALTQDQRLGGTGRLF